MNKILWVHVLVSVEKSTRPHNQYSYLKNCPQNDENEVESIFYHFWAHPILLFSMIIVYTETFHISQTFKEVFIDFLDSVLLYTFVPVFQPCPFMKHFSIYMYILCMIYHHIIMYHKVIQTIILYH